MASSNILDSVYTTTQTLLGSAAANNLSAAIAHATRTLESLLSSLNRTQTPPTIPEDPPTWLDNLNDKFIYPLTDFLSTRTALENTSILLALSTFAFLLVARMGSQDEHHRGSMSWTSRLGNLGRFSPFTRSPQNSYSSGAPKVSDADFSYITADDLRAHEAASVSAVTDGEKGGTLSESPTDYGERRETDRLLLRNKRNDYAVHFSAYSIAKGELTVRDVRDAAAKKMEVRPGRVKLLYRGRNLKDDSRRARDEGLRDGSEILCTVAEVDSDDVGGSGSESGEYEDVEAADGQYGNHDGVKKKRNRGKKTKRRNKREASATAAAAGVDSRSSTPDYHRERLDVPLSQQSTRTPSQSRPTSPKPPATPATPIDKLNALHNTLMSLQTQVDEYIRSPPQETKQREFDYKRLSETILTQVLLKLDGVETEGDVEARTRRKELVKETQGVLSRLDAVGKTGGS